MIVSDIIVNWGYSQADVIINGFSYYDDWDVNILKPSEIHLRTKATVIPYAKLDNKIALLKLQSDCTSIKNRIYIMAKPRCKIMSLDDMYLTEIDPSPLCDIDSYKDGMKLQSLPIKLSAVSSINKPDICVNRLQSSVNIVTLSSLNIYDDNLLIDLDPYTLNELDIRS